jgi:hypothetical protein
MRLARPPEGWSGGRRGPSKAGAKIGWTNPRVTLSPVGAKPIPVKVEGSSYGEVSVSNAFVDRAGLSGSDPGMHETPRPLGGRKAEHVGHVLEVRNGVRMMLPYP